MRRAVVWFPHNPLPPRTGAHRRCLSLLTSLRDLGWSSVLLSSDLAHNAWTNESVDELSSSLVREVRAVCDAGCRMAGAWPRGEGRQPPREGRNAVPRLVGGHPCRDSACGRDARSSR